MRRLQNLGLATKFVLIAILFLAPVLLLGFLFVEQSLKDIQFADRERTGINYLQEVWPCFQAALAERDPTTQESSRLAASGARYDTLMKTATARQSFADAAPGAARVAAGQNLIQKIADGSWLTLDPDLDSFYVMDVVTVKMPEVAAAEAALMDAAVFPKRAVADASEDAGSAYALGRLLRDARALDGSYETAATNNLDGSVRRTLGPELQKVLAQAEHLGRNLAGAAKTSADGSLPATAPGIANDKTMQANLNALWLDSVSKLDQLLATRIAGLQGKMYASLALAAALLVAVLVLMIAVSLSITRRLNDVASTMNAMRGGDLEHVVPHLGGSDEIGTIAQALEVFRERLISLRAFEGDIIAQETNKAAESRFREILDMSPIGIVIVTEDADPLYCNAGFVDMLGSTREQVLSRNIASTWSDGEGLMERLRRREKVRDLEKQLTRDDGAVITCLLSGEPIEYEGKQVALRWVYDISERKKAEATMRATQARLIQSEKLASLGQLTAGIAHEIKNPLNFVNNFSDLSRDLLEELKEVLAPETMDEDVRSEVAVLTGMISDNLEKVVQHGKRADSIVKNMLLHSRAGSGERRRVDINATVREALNLAYHGARAEKPGFNVTLATNFDDAAGHVEIFPQEFTRVIVNLVTNGFYAVSKRKAEGGESGYEPTLTIGTRIIPDGLEIRIHDNGTGIPEEVKTKMFTPFFTTKPPGEGTGLGLSLSHDIIVKQHEGSISIDSLQGAFTEFLITLPRSATQALRRAS